MTSLYKRASPAQARILRIVEGAIKNAGDVHPEIRVSARHRRSIAKRAAGTLSAQWVDVLAARAPSGSEGVANGTTNPRRSSLRAKTAVAGRADTSKPSPLGRVERHIYRRMRAIKQDESADYVRAMIDVLRLIAMARAGLLSDGAPLRAKTMPSNVNGMPT